MARLVDLPDQPVVSTAAQNGGNFNGGNGTVAVTLTGITSAPFAELIVDGRSYGTRATASGALAGEVAPVAWDGVRVPAPTCAWPLDRSGNQCRGLSTATAGDASADACAARCCASASCTVWQWAASKGCWVGDVPASKCTPGRITWVGGGRDAGAAAPVVVANATLLGKAGAGASAAVLARHALLGPTGPAARLVLALDAPSPATGTGTALVLDGEDVALLGARVVDAGGRLVSTGAVNVTFAVRSGPGRLVGVGSGDPASHCPPKGDACATWAGYARAIVQAAYDCASANRALLAGIDADGGTRTAVVADAAQCPKGPIVVVATARGLASATVEVPVSVDAAADGPVAVARRNGLAGRAAGAYVDGFDG